MSRNPFSQTYLRDALREATRASDRARGSARVLASATRKTGATSGVTRAQVESIVGKMHGLPANAVDAILSDVGDAEEARRRWPQRSNQPGLPDERTTRQVQLMLHDTHGKELGEQLYQRLLAGEGGPSAA